MAVPKLRFKEFDGDWNSIAIGKFLKIKSGLGFKAEEYSTEQEIRLLQIENVGYGAVKWTHNVKFVPTNYLDVHKDLVLKEGDLVLALNRPVTNDQLKIAKLTQEDSPSILYQRVGKLDFLKEDIDKEFIFQIFKKDVKNYVLNSSIGSDQPFISTTDLYKHKLCIPLKEEQTKIASFLSNVDEKINQLTQKHELLSQYKQGMMQKLFSQQIRFKADDGSEFGEWETTTLGQTGKFIGGGTPSKENSEFWEGSIPWISSSDLTEESIFKINITRFISQNALNQSATKLVPANSILIVSRVGVGKVAITPNEICTSQDFTSLTLHKGSSIFFAYLIKSLTPYLLEMNQGTSIKGFIKDDLANLELKIPCIEEQTKIANFLSAIDQKIEVVAQQIEQAKTWKKGLLQQMFI
ncbi:restriction endonuclease subunit S [Acinetobacter indicus]|uniref:restriction endonuclease subunit S n=1 Tax=Acinetobacter indicus TaxID=756892 RepID=UPI000948DDFB|nr:restriction endonuclease subunit S [Acinetobacter indicus]MCO8088886.1 restriction endonuclease subunit S [Acinetobacter indicus]